MIIADENIAQRLIATLNILNTQQVVDFFKNYSFNNLAGKFVTISKDNIRIRQIDIA